MISDDDEAEWEDPGRYKRMRTMDDDEEDPYTIHASAYYYIIMLETMIVILIRRTRSLFPP